MKTRTVQSEWDSFVAMVLPTDAGPIQRQEMRRAFYAGAEASLRMQWDIGEEDVTEAEGMRMLDAWDKELKQFAADVAAGRK